MHLLSHEDEYELAHIAAISHDVAEFTSISWKGIAAETKKDSILSLLVLQLLKGFPSSLKELESSLHSFWNIKESLYVGDEGVVMCGDRVVIPTTLHGRVLKILHAAHQGVPGMESRAQALLYWPGISADIKKIRSDCLVCCRNAPSQAAVPPRTPEIPSTPFESVFADFFDISNYHYLVVGDRLSGWVEVFSTKPGSTSAGAGGLISHLRSLFATFGVPETLSTDGGPEFVASSTENFLQKWGVQHRISSAYFPQSNGQAEVAVKKVKRFLLSCIGPSGSLKTDRFLCGMLQLRNTPDPDCKLSPAQIVFGRPLRCFFIC